MKVLDKKKNQVILEETAPLSFKNDKATQTLKQSSQENYLAEELKMVDLRIKEQLSRLSIRTIG